jgi:hypothetical protein
MPTTSESMRSLISTLERDIAWLQAWLTGDRTRKGLKLFYGHQPWIDETDHWKLVTAARDTLDTNRSYLERLRAELATLSSAA